MEGEPGELDDVTHISPVLSVDENVSDLCSESSSGYLGVHDSADECVIYSPPSQDHGYAYTKPRVGKINLKNNVKYVYSCVRRNDDESTSIYSVLNCLESFHLYAKDSSKPHEQGNMKQHEEKIVDVHANSNFQTSDLLEGRKNSSDSESVSCHEQSNSQTEEMDVRAYKVVRKKRPPKKYHKINIPDNVSNEEYSEYFLWNAHHVCPVCNMYLRTIAEFHYHFTGTCRKFFINGNVYTCHPCKFT